MDDLENVRRSLKKFATQTVFQIATVVAVDKVKAVCSVKLLEDEEIILEGVRLQAIDNEQDNGFLTFPKVESSVIIGKLDNVNIFWLTMVSEVEEIIWKIDNKEILKINGTKITFNEGQKGAIVEIAKLKTQLNNLENAFNQLLNHYKAHNHLHPQGPTTGLIAPSVQATLQTTQTADLDNQNILL